MKRKTLVAAAAAVTAMIGLIAAPAAAHLDSVQVYQGSLAGAEYRAEVPAGWNGTLVLWSHADYRFGYVPAEIEIANHPATRQWLLDHGYAVAASKFQPVSGWVVRQALADQLALLHWFGQTVGRPQRTIAEGASMGGLVTTLLAERYPAIDGAVTLCGDQAGSTASWNTGLDMAYAVKTLLDPAGALQLVHITDPAANQAYAINLIRTALTTAQGRARFALAAALADVAPWSNPVTAPPIGLDAQLAQQAGYYGILLGFSLGVDRTQLEQLVGGNPSWNIGVDYRRQLDRSPQRTLAEQAYGAAGLDLNADLDLLAAAPRIAPDPQAVLYQAIYGTPDGTTRVPVVTVHTTGDGLTPASQQRQYADQVARHGDTGRFRQLFVARGGHCTITAAEEIIALRTLFARLDSGTWPSTDPAALTDATAAYPAEFQTVHLPSGSYASVAAAFVDYTPSPYLRPFPS
jgi:pimeloyl-ACP methyl ester carboxylesterase